MRRSYHTNDGDRYTTNWDRNPATAEPVVSIHHYENRVQCASDVYNFPEVSEEDVKFYGLFSYPKLRDYSSPVILGYNAPEADKKLRYLNGFLGPKKRIRLWVLVYKGKTLQSAKMQEDFWKGGNKNEFIFCVGLDKTGKEVKRGHIISWTEKYDLKIEARDLLNNMGKFDPMKIVEFTSTEVAKKFKKKSFEEFNYLKVQPTGLAVGISYFIVFIINLGMAIWIVKNDHHDNRGRR